MLHPQARALIDLMVERGVPPTHTLSPADARKFYRERRTFTQNEPLAVAEVRDLTAESGGAAIPLRLYRPAGSQATDALPVLVYYHGGGWVIGDLDTHDVLCRELANGSGCAVVAVDYRMGPEHRFPAAVDDVLAATRWVRTNAVSLGVDADRLAVGGDSAGGNLAAVVAIAARDAGDLPIAFQLLIYPATDMRRGHASHVTNGDGYMLTKDTIAYFHDHYIIDPAHDLDWRASPLLQSDLKGLPPSLLITAGYDPLRDEGLDYARALTAAGNRVSYVCFERQIHGFITMGRVLDEANTAVSLCSAELRRALKALA
ncbi:alpha/beta hydrolase [Variovorax sp. PAMC 28711]|uniref:alpha/beta hydrolase n=1 Tax=Variovorax sp. PAMC 28711 TaxID=1795631 RepID=UPI00078BE84A|nr:alpha/beta hydrolase [Variovorax sp. PAMC 28711]AMM24244.1 acetyl hydrolase [Variovorax sp. PAMC 28711]